MELSEALCNIAATPYVDVTKLLLEHGADIDHQGAKGSPLFRAIGTHQEEQIDFLLANGANVNLTEKGKNNYVHHFITKNNIEGVKKMIKHNADLTVVNSERLSPLDMACACENLEIAKLLLDQGVDPNVSNSAGTPLFCAARRNDIDLVKLLLTYPVTNIDKLGPNQTALETAADLGNLDVMTILLEAGANPNILSAYNTTALKGAILNGQLGSIELLLKYSKTNVNIQFPNGETVLFAAVYSCNEQIVQMLIDHGADTQICDKDGRLAIDYSKYDTITKILTVSPKFITPMDADGNVYPLLVETKLVGASCIGGKNGVCSYITVPKNSQIKYVEYGNGTWSDEKVLTINCNLHVEIANDGMLYHILPMEKDVVSIRFSSIRLADGSVKKRSDLYV